MSNQENKKRAELLVKKVLKYLAPPLDLSIVEWAEKYRILSNESSAEPGKYRIYKTPYAREPMQRFTQEGVKELILMWGAQLSKSEMLNNIFGRFAHLDPCPMLLVQPTETLAINYSKERIQPMIRDTKILESLIKDVGTKGGGNTISHKMFPGGFLAFIGTGTPANLASRPIRIAFCDEIDRYTITREGNPITLVRKRLQTFEETSKLFLSGTPTIKGSSLIETEYEASSKAIWCVPCPECGEYQEINWEKLQFNKDNPDDEPVMRCEECGTLNNEKAWKRENQKDGKWIHEDPTNEKLGYKASALIGPWRTWKDIVKEFIECKDDLEKLKSFKNTVLAETWEEEIKDKIDYETLLNRREDYDSLPEEVLIITLSIDMQDRWAELEFIGFGLGFESWGLGHYLVYGNPETKEFWNDIEKYILTKFKDKNGRELKVEVTAIDTGGHYTEQTYDFVSPRQQTMNVFGIKGIGGRGVPAFNGFRRTKCNKIDLLSLGVNALKDVTYSRLKIDKPGRGYCHFPKDVYKNYHEEYFKALTAEVKMVKKTGVVWEKIRKRNEALDIRNYAQGVLYALGIDDKALEKLSQLSKGHKKIKKSKIKYENGVNL